MQAAPFQFVGGDPSLDFVNTVDWTSTGPENERLTDYPRLTRWAEAAGVLSRGDALRARQAGAAHPSQARAAHEAALRMRRVLERLLVALVAGRPAEPLWSELNELLGSPLARVRLRPAHGDPLAAWTWPDPAKDLESVIWPVLWSAAALLTSNEARSIRVCAGRDCGWMFVDRSRNGLRRWCQMEICGTREKSRRRAARRAR